MYIYIYIYPYIYIYIYKDPKRRRAASPPPRLNRREFRRTNQAKIVANLIKIKIKIIETTIEHHSNIVEKTSDNFITWEPRWLPKRVHVWRILEAPKGSQTGPNIDPWWLSNKISQASKQTSNPPKPFLISSSEPNQNRTALPQTRIKSEPYFLKLQLKNPALRSPALRRPSKSLGCLASQIESFRYADLLPLISVLFR